MNPKLIAIKIAKLLNDKCNMSFIVVEQEYKNLFDSQYYIIQKNVYAHIVQNNIKDSIQLKGASDYVVSHSGHVSKARNEQFIKDNRHYIFVMNEMEKLLYG